MNKKQEMWEDALEYAFDDYLADYPDGWKPSALVDAIRRSGDELGSMIGKHDKLDGLVIADQYEWCSGEDLAHMITITANTYITFAKRWGA